MTDEWIKRCIQRDGEAFEKLVRTYTPSVWRVAVSMLRNEQDANDAVQETFLKIYKAIPQFRGDAALSTWIYRIAVNTCKDLLRSGGKNQVVYIDDTQEVWQIADNAPSPEDAALSEERTLFVRSAIHALPPDYRTVVTLCDIEGFAYEEAARLLHCPVGTVKSRLSRARQLLCKTLRKQELFATPERLNKKKEEPDI